MYLARMACVIALAAAPVVSCSNASDSSSAGTAAKSSAKTGTTGTTAPCPNPEGEACLGDLAPGTYTTKVFQPTLTYTVPAGWRNYEDTPGNFLLVPPDGDLPGVNGGTSDFIGVYSSVGPAAGCESGQVASGFLSTPDGFKKWASHQPAFKSAHFRPVTVGGLSGLVADFKLPPGWAEDCPFSPGLPVAPLITGLGITALDHNVITGQVTRLYLLDHLQGALAIEIVDIKNAGHLAALSDLVQKMRFAT